MFVFSSEKIVNFNRILFVLLLLAVLLSIANMVASVDFRGLPKVAYDIQISKVCVIFPTLFTSFGFQGSLHSLTKFCNNDIKMLKIACLWGSLIPAVVYLGWTFSVMAIIYNHQSELFAKMISNGIDVNELITGLSAAADVTFVKRAVVVISALAIVTSIFGVGVALVEDLEMAFNRWNVKMEDRRMKRTISSLLAVLPAVLVAAIVPEAFIKTLSFAGMILAILAIFLPSFLLFKINQPLKMKILNNRAIVLAIVGFGLMLVTCEMASILGI
jgi:tyrosine-specific transport protein